MENISPLVLQILSSGLAMSILECNKPLKCFLFTFTKIIALLGQTIIPISGEFSHSVD